MEVSTLDKYRKSDKWHADRKDTLRGSDVTALAKGHYKYIMKIWRAKTGNTNHVEEPGLPALMGTVLEDLNRDWFQNKTGRIVHSEGMSIVHPTIPWIGASLDGITTSEDGREAYFEAKAVTAFKEINKLYKLHQEEFGNLILTRKWEETAIVPLLMQEYKAQCHVAMACGGWSVSVLSMLIGNRHFIKEIEWDHWYWLELLQLMEEFWVCVKEDKKPGKEIFRGVQ